MATTRHLSWLLAAVMLAGSSPASCQKTRVLLRGPFVHGHATPQQADSVAEELRHQLTQTGFVELLLPSPPAPQVRANANTPAAGVVEPMADEVIDAKLHKSGETYTLTLTAVEAVEHLTYTSRGEAKSLAEFVTTLMPEFVQRFTERHGPERVVIRVERGFDIYPMDKYFGVSDPFVEVYVDTILVGVTDVRQDEKDPVWNQAFVLPPGAPRDITLVVCDKDALEHRELIGKLMVPWGRDGTYAIRRPRYVRDFGKIHVSFGR